MAGENKEHLIPAKAGEIRNPNGRPKGSINAKTILKRFLACEADGKNPFTGELEKFTIAEIMNLKQIERAINGDLASYKEITDRMEGKTTAVIEQKSEITQTLKIGYGGSNEDVE